MFHVAFEKTGQMRENVLSWAIKFGRLWFQSLSKTEKLCVPLTSALYCN